MSTTIEFTPLFNRPNMEGLEREIADKGFTVEELMTGNTAIIKVKENLTTGQKTIITGLFKGLANIRFS